MLSVTVVPKPRLNEKGNFPQLSFCPKVVGLTEDSSDSHRDSLPFEWEIVQSMERLRHTKWNVILVNCVIATISGNTCQYGHHKSIPPLLCWSWSSLCIKKHTNAWFPSCVPEQSLVTSRFCGFYYTGCWGLLLVSAPFPAVQTLTETYPLITMQQ